MLLLYDIDYLLSDTKTGEERADRVWGSSEIA